MCYILWNSNCDIDNDVADNNVYDADDNHDDDDNNDDDDDNNDDDNNDDEIQVDDGGQYDCEIEADGDLPISVSHRLDILLPPRVIVIIIISYTLGITSSWLSSLLRSSTGSLSSNLWSSCI